MIRRPPRSTLSSSSAASDVYKRQGINADYGARIGKMPQIKYDKVGQTATDDDDDPLGPQRIAVRSVATHGILFRALCALQVLFAVLALFTNAFWMSIFAVEAVVGLAVWPHLLGSPSQTSRAVIWVYFRVKISMFILTAAFYMRALVKGDSVGLDVGGFAVLCGLLFFSMMGICVAAKLQNSLPGDENDFMTQDTMENSQSAVPRITVVNEADEDDWEGEQQRVKQFEVEREQQLERDLKRAEAMEAEMELEGASTESSMDQMAADQEENEMVAALIREGRHEEAAKLKAMIAPPSTTVTNEPKKSKKKKKRKGLAVPESNPAAHPAPAVTAMTIDAMPCSDQDQGSDPQVKAPVPAPAPAAPAPAAAAVVTAPALQNPLAAFEKAWMQALFVEEKEIDMAFSLDAADVESFLAEADFTCIASGAPVSYTHLRAHETPEHLVCRLLLEKKKKEHNKQAIVVFSRQPTVKRRMKQSKGRARK
eukprot:TRINITY_DN59870_c0_g1_i2.p1 TRINITY_DN59870_c0_g1~~TRINITY_DN59870_c0_g1_i2.p1  ORF type:complete len:482 (+),score=132.65 TRINITY_DN59870_c0_g1_i2:122-1567(+)